MFDGQRRLHKYRTIEEIIDGYMEVRYAIYEKRKAHLIENLTRKTTEVIQQSEIYSTNIERGSRST